MTFTILVAVAPLRSPIGSKIGAGLADRGGISLGLAFDYFVYSNDSCSINLDKLDVSLARRISPIFRQFEV